MGSSSLLPFLYICNSWELLPADLIWNFPHIRPILGPRGLLKDQLGIPFRKSNLYFVTAYLSVQDFLCLWGPLQPFTLFSVDLENKSLLIIKRAGDTPFLLEAVPRASDWELPFLHVIWSTYAVHESTTLFQWLSDFDKNRLSQACFLPSH